MKIIEKYVYAVTILLPEKNREDIKKELTSLIWDAVDERAGGSIPDEKTAAAVLKELGSPSEMAKKYTGEPEAVISPELTGIFWQVVRMVLPIMLILAALGFIAEFAVDRAFPGNAVQLFSDMISSFIEAGISGFGMIVLVFTAITRVRRNRGIKENKREWDPADLPEISDSGDRVKLSDMIARIIFTLIGFYIFNFTPVIFLASAGSFNRAVLDAHLPVFNIALAANLIFSVVMLFKFRWTTVRRIVDICLGGFTLYALAAILLDPDIFTAVSEVEEVIYGVTIGLRITVGIIGVVWIADIIKHIRRILVKA